MSEAKAVSPSPERAWKSRPHDFNYESSFLDAQKGSETGFLLPLETVPTDYYAVAYTVPVLVGSTRQNLSLQVDTGSSDMWIASNSCLTLSCTQTQGRLYDSSASDSSGFSFDIQYLKGAASGTIVWDTIEIGDLRIENQALGKSKLFVGSSNGGGGYIQVTAAASSVTNEQLAVGFNGILGLALPRNSVILQQLHSGAAGMRSGTTFSSNIFSLGASSTTPLQPFISLVLTRPDFYLYSSLLGIGRHPAQIVPNPSKVTYFDVLAGNSGPLFWQMTVSAITVYNEGRPQHVTLGQSRQDVSYPSAVLDSGVPLILTSTSIANGIYGALGIQPAANGQYYVPCATPLNMTFTIGGQLEIPMHPLDLTFEPPDQTSPAFCTGLIQSADELFAHQPNTVEMVLGVPFLRNVYTVMAYQPPDASGNFQPTTVTRIQPHIGLLSLTNSSAALEEFHAVRVLKVPIGPTDQKVTSIQHDNNFPIGAEVLLALVGFLLLGVCIFGARFFWMRHHFYPSVGSFPADIGHQDKSGVTCKPVTRSPLLSTNESQNLECTFLDYANMDNPDPKQLTSNIGDVNASAEKLDSAPLEEGDLWTGCSADCSEKDSEADKHFGGSLSSGCFQTSGTCLSPNATGTAGSSLAVLADSIPLGAASNHDMIGSAGSSDTALDRPNEKLDDDELTSAPREISGHIGLLVHFAGRHLS